MKILLDTHVFLWAIDDNPKLSKKAGRYFLDPANELYFSVASMWEISIKISIGKLKMRGNWSLAVNEEVNANGIQWAPIEPEHCVIVEKLPWRHRDPFDRMIVAQAMRGGMKLLTNDPRMRSYEVPCIW